MKMRSVWCIFAILLTSVACFGQAAVVAHSSIDIPYDDTVFAPCTNEWVSFTGSMHMDADVIYDGNGGTHTLVVTSDQGISGVGASGLQYQMVGSENDSINYRGLAPFEETLTVKFRVISSGTSPDQFSYVLFHISVAANLSITSVVSQTNISCTN